MALISLIGPEKVLDLSIRHRITAYDANFIALSMEMDILCVTEDRELKNKFPLIALSMEAFVKRGRAAGEVRERRVRYRTRRKDSARGNRIYEIRYLAVRLVDSHRIPFLRCTDMYGTGTPDIMPGRVDMILAAAAYFVAFIAQ
jgi:hypothetical protein